MIPIRLRNALKVRMEIALENQMYKRPATENDENQIDPLVPIKIFEQRLPIKSEEEETPFPFLLIKLVSGEQTNLINGQHVVEVNFVVGIYDMRNENSGEDDVASVINKVLEDLQSNPIIDGFFELDFESSLSWSISDEENQPYYFGAVSAFFRVSKLMRQDLEGFM